MNYFDIFFQHVNYSIERGVLGLSKELTHTVLEYLGEDVQPAQKFRFDSTDSLVVPVMPPTLLNICKLLQIYYILTVSLFINQSFDYYFIYSFIIIGFKGLDRNGKIK